MATPETEYYFQRFGFCQRQIPAAPRSELGIVVVIPCYNEPDLIGCLESLWRCERPGCSVEVILVVNSPAGCAGEAVAQNRATRKDADEWIGRHRDPDLEFHPVHFPELPPKQAGVGLARKIGMDEALRRFDEIGRMDGIIAGFDADCRCERNYLTAIEGHFWNGRLSPGCSIYFEHPLSGPFTPEVYEAVAAYELHLRYYVQALRFAGFPHAYHTVGSCMAVRAGAYRKQGGMNKRKAGEDFYFLHKIIPLGGFSDLTGTTVHPSPRPSDRVPFGTGMAVSRFLIERKIKTYPLEAFFDLKLLFDHVEENCRAGKVGNIGVTKEFPAPVRSFLEQQRFGVALAEMRANTASAAAFQKRFFLWFDGFRAMKFIHHARDHFYGPGSVEEQAGRLLAATGAVPDSGPKPSIQKWLGVYRELDRAAFSSEQ
ncbi:MAG TPA: hypothetical protein VN887_12460 [Candidatus Angelobacter sp.]|nr:hypothetical protein [Candidatus Angelobacter sp.]